MRVVNVLKYMAANLNIPLFPQPTAGQFPAVSPERHAPFHSAPPSDPDHWLHDTSEKVPVRAP